jgi:hypothetical protein
MECKERERSVPKFKSLHGCLPKVHTRIASMPLNLDFLWLSRTMMKGLPYSSVAYTAELGSMEAIMYVYGVKRWPKNLQTTSYACSLEILRN